MDFALNEVADAYVHSVRRLSARLRNDEAGARDLDGCFPRDLWAELAKVGLTGLPVPAEYGGQGAGGVATVAALAALGEVCHDNGLMFALGAHLWACTDPIATYGTDRQRQRWLPGLCDGTLVGAHAATEAEAGSDAAAIVTTARHTGTGWVLNGAKTFVTNAPVADVFLVTAVTDGSRGAMGISTFLAPRGTTGLTVGTPIGKSGLHSAPMAEVSFDGCELSDDALLGTVGAGMPIFTSAMTRERLFILAPVVGVLRRLADDSGRYAGQRRQFGRPIAEFGAVSDRIAEMRMRATSAELFAYWGGWLADTGRVRPDQAAMVKLHLSEAFLASALDAVQVHGGHGYATELGLERMVRDAMGARAYSGTSDIQRNLIARAGVRFGRAGTAGRGPSLATPVADR